MAAPVCYLQCSVSACPFCHSLSFYEMKKHLSINRRSKQMINVVCKKLWESAMGRSSSIKVVNLPNRQSKRHSPHKTSEWRLLKDSQRATWTGHWPVFLRALPLRCIAQDLSFTFSPKNFLLFLSWSLPRHQTPISTSAQGSNYVTDVLALKAKLLR